jgi:predicted nucleic acid-binding protein
LSQSLCRLGFSRSRLRLVEAAKIQEALTEQAQHRSASIPALILAATARARSLEILHYDQDFDAIARFTEQPARWIVPPGTV